MKNGDPILQEFILEAPAEMQAATYYELPETSHPYNKITVDNLTGCMGLICAIKSLVGDNYQSALLVHDASDGYPHAKKLLEDFIYKNRAHKDRMQIVWSAKHTDWGQGTYMANSIESNSIELMKTGIGTSTSISWPKNFTGSTEKQKDKNIIYTKIDKLSVIDKNHKNWQPDASSSNCSICKSIFTFTNRKHHCRNCGRLACNACTPKSSLHGGAYFNAMKVDMHRYCKICVPVPGSLDHLRW